MRKIKKENIVSLTLWVIMIVLGTDIIIKGLKLDKNTWKQIMKGVQQQAIEIYLPGIVEDKKEKTIISWVSRQIEAHIPMQMLDVKEDKDLLEDQTTSKRIIEENTDFLEEKLMEENKETVVSVAENNKVVEKAPVTDIPLEKFQDFNYVMSSFYTVDKTTSMSEKELNAPELVGMDMRMQISADQPQILIYHSHSQEGFIDSVPGDPATTIVGVGEYLTELLRNTYHYNVIHVTDTFDIVDGKLDRNKAYNFAQKRVGQILEENPSVEVVIDLHRDGVPENKRLVTNVNGKQTARIMFFNGLSRTNKNGNIDYLPNPYIRENLAFSLQMMLEAKRYYPELARTIYLRGYRYNLHLRPKALLIECGAQTNTVEEEKNAMEPLADILNKVLTGR